MPETVNHYLLNCDLYLPQRRQLFQDISKIDNHYNNTIHHTTQDILFPHIHQQYIKCIGCQTAQLMDRCEILNAVTKYVWNSQRFEMIGDSAPFDESNHFEIPTN